MATSTHRGPSPTDKALRGWLSATLDSLDNDLVALAATAPATPDARAWFRRARRHYKELEAPLAYYDATLCLVMNGPPSAEMVLDGHTTGRNDAKGLQRIEPVLFPSLDAHAWPLIADEVPRMRAELRHFRDAIPLVTADPSALLYAARIELARVSTLGIAGFDAPLSRDGIVESAAAVDGIRVMLRLGAPASAARTDSALARAERALATHPTFDTFDRFRFITLAANPAFDAIGAARRAVGQPLPALRRAWPMTVDRVYDVRAFDPMPYAPDDAPVPTPALVNLGRTLFFDPTLSGNGQRACASCHVPEHAFSNANVRDLAFNGDMLARNTPSLLNAAFQPMQFDDSRSLTLEDQLAVVLANDAEMRSSLAIAVSRVGRRAEYRTQFAAVFGRQDTIGTSATPVTTLRLRIALAAYVRSLTALNSRFDRAIRGDAVSLSAAERRGFNVFMGKGGCGTCHFAPLFNGTTPPDFVESEVEVIGVPSRPVRRGAVIDPDSGRADFDHLAGNLHAFKVPTVRNAALTAPYMHNGVYRTLEQVLDFYNRGGGVGIGATVPNQTLPTTPLRLSAREQRDVIAFIKSLTDTAGTTARPRHLPGIS